MNLERHGTEPPVLRTVSAAKDRAAAERAKRTPEEQARVDADLVQSLGLKWLPSRADEPGVWQRKPG